MELLELIAVGKELEYEGSDLHQWMKRQQAWEREDGALEREAAKEQAEAEDLLRETKRKWQESTNDRLAMLPCPRPSLLHHLPLLSHQAVHGHNNIPP